MAVVFLIGGTGNQLFQFASSEEKDSFSTVFLDGMLPRILKWSRHPVILNLPYPSFGIDRICLIVLAFDIAIARLFGWALVSNIDLRFCKARPVLFRMVQIGYFQSTSGHRTDIECREVLVKSGKVEIPLDLCLHVRGGDLAVSMRESEVNALRLYYERSVASLLCSAVATESTLVNVYSDDLDFAKFVLGKLDKKNRLKYVDCGLDEMIRQCVYARIFVSGNSTLSYWIARVRPSDLWTGVPNVFYTKSILVFSKHWRVFRIDKE